MTIYINFRSNIDHGNVVTLVHKDQINWEIVQILVKCLLDSNAQVIASALGFGVCQAAVSEARLTHYIPKLTFKGQLLIIFIIALSEALVLVVVLLQSRRTVILRPAIFDDQTKSNHKAQNLRYRRTNLTKRLLLSNALSLLCTPLAHSPYVRCRKFPSVFFHPGRMYYMHFEKFTLA